MVKPNFTPGVGGLATSRYDFENHIEGLNFRHNAIQIDVNPAVIIQGVPYITVADALAAISGFVAQSATNGQGFVTIGDGYNTYHASNVSILNPPPNANFPYDSTTPSLDAALNDLLSNANNPLNSRIRDGGIVLIKAGTYKFTDTVIVPPGIIIAGEGFGTKIANAMSSPKPLFKVKSDASKNYGTAATDPGSDSTSKFIVTRQTIFTNLVIADNFIEPKFLGDTAYKNPINITANNPLVSVEEGANFTADKVIFLGRATRSGLSVTGVTSYAIQTDHSVPSTLGTIVNVRNCFIDGVALALQTTSLGGNNDFVTFTNNYVRAFGVLAGDSSSASANCILYLTATNINVQNNHCIGEISTVTSLLFIDTLASSPPVLQAYSKIIVSNNNIAVNRTSASTNSTFKTIKIDSSILSSIATYLSAVSYENNFQDTLEWKIEDANDSPQMQLTPSILNVNTNATVSGLFANGYQSIVVTSTSMTLTAAQSSSHIIKFTGTLTGDTVITLPNTAGYAKLFYNLTSGAFNLTVIASGGAGTILPRITKQWVYCDGTNLVSGVSHQLISTSTYANTGTYGSVLDTASTSGFHDSSISVTVPQAQNGDILQISGRILVKADPLSIGDYLVTVVDGASVSSDLLETEYKTVFTSSTIPAELMTFSTSVILGASGLATVKIRFATNVPGVANTYTLNRGSMVVNLIRP